MSNEEIPWLLRVIDGLYVVTGTLFGVAGTIYIGERASFGLRGRQLVIDNFRTKISWPSETFGETVVSDFAHVKSVRVVSSRDDWYRMGRTYSVVASHADDSGKLESTIIQRSYGRRRAVALAATIKSMIAPKPQSTVSEERMDQLALCLRE
jgi:hypothetical protein